MADDVLTFEELRRVQSRERDSDTLQELDEDFFPRAARYLEMKRDDSDHLQAQEYRNAKNIVQDVLDMRQKKIVKLAFLSVKSGVNVENLLSHEEELFEQVEDAIGAYRHDRRQEVFEHDGEAGADAAAVSTDTATAAEADATGGAQSGEAADAGGPVDAEVPEDDPLEESHDDAPDQSDVTDDEIEGGEDYGEDKPAEHGEAEDETEPSSDDDDSAEPGEDDDDEEAESAEPDEETEETVEESEGGTDEQAGDDGGSGVDDILEFDGEDEEDAGDEDDEPDEETSDDEDAEDDVDTAEADGDGDELVTVTVTERIPAFMGTDLTAYGPFDEGEEVEIPAENAEVLADQGKAERRS